jgi:RimJ/RimL family protein N-acetyltransferase
MGFNLQPILEGRNLMLRPLSLEDHEPLFLAARDPLIWQQHPAPQRYQSKAFASYFAHLLASKSALAIIDQTVGRMIGTSSYYIAQDVQPAHSIGFTFLERAYWGGQTNRDVKTLMLTHLFNNSDKAWFHIGPENKRSRKGTEKLGAIFSHQRELDLGTGLSLYDCLFLERGTWKNSQT